MTSLQKEAIALIPGIPDEDLYHVVQIIKRIRVSANTNTSDQETRNKAFAVIDSLRRPAPELDYNEELEKWRDEKYAL